MQFVVLQNINRRMGTAGHRIPLSPDPPALRPRRARSSRWPSGSGIARDGSRVYRWQRAWRAGAGQARAPVVHDARGAFCVEAFAGGSSREVLTHVTLAAGHASAARAAHHRQLAGGGCWVEPWLAGSGCWRRRWPQRFHRTGGFAWPRCAPSPLCVQATLTVAATNLTWRQVHLLALCHPLPGPTRRWRSLRAALHGSAGNYSCSLSLSFFSLSLIEFECLQEVPAESIRHANLTWI